MLFLLSPAKTLDYDSPLPAVTATKPRFLNHSAELIEQLQDFSEADIEKLMKISPKLSALNAQRFQQWGQRHNTSTGARPCLFAFKGDVYQGLDAYSLSSADIQKAQQSLRILSGLYGILKPLDFMHPYRLEMGTRLENARGKNLYEFWGEIPTESLNQELEKESNPAVINLASNEYFSVIDEQALKAPVITPVFKDWKNDKYKIISFHAKKARGLMAAWAIQNDIQTPEGFQDFSEAGYRYSPKDSTETTLTFLRKQ